MVDVAKEGVDGVTGGKATSAWLEGIAARHAEDVEKAGYALEEMPWR